MLSRLNLLWSGLGDDVRHGLRRMRYAPGFTAIAILTLALGLGANTAVFTLVNAVMFAPLPVPAPDELYRLGDDSACCVNSGLQDSYSIFSWPLYKVLRESAPEFTSLAAFQATTRPMGLRQGEGGAQAVLTQFVSPNYFETFGVRPAVGRTWNSGASAVGGAVPLVLSDTAWQSHFQRDPGIVGTSMTLNGTPAVIVGVMPASFYGEALRPNAAEVWMPLPFEPLVARSNSILESSAANWLYIVGRLKPGTSTTALETKLSGVLQRWLGATITLSAQDKTQLPHQHVVLASARTGVTLLRYANEQALRLLSFAALAVLFIACANLANLLLVRGLGRGPELALRTALGAPRARLIRGAIVDSVLLAIAGGIAGLALANAGASALVRLAFPAARGMPAASAMATPVLAFSIGLSLAAALLFGVLPAVITSRASALDSIRGAGRVVGDRGSWTRRVLVVVQVGLSLALIASAGLLGRSAYNLQAQSFGFDADGRVIVSLDPSLGGLTPQQLPATYERLTDQISAVSHVKSMSLSLYGPMVGNNWSSGISIEGRPNENLGASWDRVTANYFETIGTRVLRGRVFGSQDTPSSERVAVVNETFAAQMFPKLDPIGRRFGFRSDNGQHVSDFVVIGLVADAKYASGRAKPNAMFFLPFFQDIAYTQAGDLNTQRRSNYAADIELWVQTPAPALERDVRAAIARVSPSLIIRRFLPMDQQIATNFTRERLVTWLAGIFAALAMVLACVGLYGVTAYAVSRRTKEIGLRMALGADRGRVMGHVLSGALTQTAVGLLVGVPAALGAGRLLWDQLFNVPANDVAILATAAGVLVLATAIAGAIPARRAASIDPVSALRSD